MTIVQKIAKNTGIFFAGNIAFKLISTIVIIYLARYLGTAGFGKYSFVFAYIAFFNIVTDLGLQQILVRELSRNPLDAPKIVGNAYLIRITLTILAFIASIAVISFLQYPEDTKKYVYIATFYLIFISFSDFYATIFQANLRMEYNVIPKITSRLISAGLILWVILVLKGSLTQIFLIIVFSESVKTLLSYIFSRKLVHAKFEIDFGLLKFLIKESLPLAIFSVISVIHFRTDIIMLSLIVGDAPVGIYSAAYSLSNPLTLIPSAILISLFPIMSESFQTSEERLVKIYKLSFKYILIIMLPIAVGTTIIADKIIPLVYTAKYISSITPLQILIWALLLASINAIMVNLLVSSNNQRLSTISVTLGALINIPLNLVLIPIWSYNGAAIATVITKVMILGANIYFISKYLQFSPPLSISTKPLSCAFLMGLFLCGVKNFNIILVIFSAILVYFATLLIMRTFSDEDINIFKRALYFFKRS